MSASRSVSARPTRRAVLLIGALLVAARPAIAYAASAADLAALNGVLAIEHALIYDLAAAGATLPVAARATVLRHYDEHRAQRDRLTERIRALGGTPVAALAAYADPAAGQDAGADIVAAEQAAVRAYHQGIGSVEDPAARLLCAQAFLSESRHLALARAAGGLPGAPAPFVTGA